MNSKITDVDEVVLFVKCGNSEVFSKCKNVYVDIVDGITCLSTVVNYPHVTVVVLSERAKEYVENRIPNKVIVLPQHHCNFENAKRTRDKVEVLGYVGSQARFPWNVQELREKLESINIRFEFLDVTFDNVPNMRKLVCDFYKKIDINLAGASNHHDLKLFESMPPELKVDLKFLNAASFKIPTIGYPEMAMKNRKGRYIEATTIDDIVEGCDILKDDRNYKHFASVAEELSGAFHISEIIEEYREKLNIH